MVVKKKPIKKKVTKKPVAKKKSSKKGTYKIQNIVATTSLEKPVPLTKLARTQPNTEYNPETFPGLVLRIKEPKSAVSVFSVADIFFHELHGIGRWKAERAFYQRFPH